MDAQSHGAMPGLAAPELAHHDVVDLASLGSAAAHAVVAPTTGTTPDAANVGRPVQTETPHLTFEKPTDDGKPFATPRVVLALKGHSLSPTAASDEPVCWYVTRRGTARELHDLAAMTRLLDQEGGAHA